MKNEKMNKYVKRICAVALFLTVVVSTFITGSSLTVQAEETTYSITTEGCNAYIRGYDVPITSAKPGQEIHVNISDEIEGYASSWEVTGIEYQAEFEYQTGFYFIMPDNDVTIKVNFLDHTTEISKFQVKGIIGQEIEPVELQIKYTQLNWTFPLYEEGDDFTEAMQISYITNFPEGLKATVVRREMKLMTVQITGTVNTPLDVAPVYKKEDCIIQGDPDSRFSFTESNSIPSITTQPADVAVTEGSTAIFTVAAEGKPTPSYQWQIDRNDNNGFVDISDATNASYTTPVTATDNNGYKYRCVVKNSEGEVISGAATLTVNAAQVTTYKIIDGANSTWTPSSDGTLSIRGDGEVSKFVSVKVDGVIVDAANYTVTSGSTIITFTKDYLNTLSAGNHTFDIAWTDGSASTSFTVNTTPQKDVVPKTGDATPIAWLFIVAVISGAGVVYFGRKKKTVR